MQTITRQTELAKIFPATTSSAEATVELGASFSTLLEAGDVVALSGPLGAGKTHFVKGIATGLGYQPDDVTSPTFGIVQEHRGRRLTLYHFDAYRIKDPEELEEIGFHEYLEQDAVCILEWPERIPDLLPARTMRISIEIENEGAARRFRFQPAD